MSQQSMYQTYLDELRKSAQATTIAEGWKRIISEALGILERDLKDILLTDEKVFRRVLHTFFKELSFAGSVAVRSPEVTVGPADSEYVNQPGLANALVGVYPAAAYSIRVDVDVESNTIHVTFCKVPEGGNRRR